MRGWPRSQTMVIRCAVRAMPLLALCGCAGYTFGGTRYRSANYALKAQAAALEEQLAQIAPMGYVGGSVLVPMPADRELTEPPYADQRVNRVSPQHSFLLRYWRRDINAVSAALDRSESFDTAEVRRTDEPGVYAREYGYRFVLRDQGPRWFLDDVLTGYSRELHGVGLRDLAQRAQAAASALQAAHQTPTAKSSQPATETPKEDKSGGFTLSFPGEALEARARMLARARDECSGAFRIDDEFLQDELLTLRFTCRGQRLSAR